MTGFSGQFFSRGRIQGRGISVDTLSAEYDLTSTFKEFKQNQADIDPLDMNVQVSGDINQRLLTLDQLTLDTRPAQVQGSGTYHLADQVLDMDVIVSSDDLEAATRASACSGPGRVSATVQAHGPVMDRRLPLSWKDGTLGQPEWLWTGWISRQPWTPRGKER